MSRFYECDICGAIHPWEFNGDCRDDANRLNLEDIGSGDELLSMKERIAADLGMTLEQYEESES